jgi:2'-5' RNA ligase
MTRKTLTASSRKQRLFMGIKFTLYEEIQPAIIDVARTLTDKKVKFRMSPPQNLHLTLKFLGSVLESDLRKIDSIVSHAATRHRAMQLHCAGIGFFKNSIWIGIKDNLL